ncbi:GNAT family N-acetyltransferase [Aporhodopirellula aestuarii]|uniref:N-acetyltransferase n=1 Tax=Aporhodopirellula aestuarii TaxID=2950107 RepID=A0ABT0UF85_9BACT|nr:N-acetyltransferase [Aporhodopirellula aestuarii]MCM2374933.1 N-acetyltransferase [Aporhodopirellula aestuarii]
MTQDKVRIRNATDRDRDSILAIHRNAFGVEGGEVIAKLVDEMLDDASGEPMLSLVAETDGELVGHLLFTSATIEPEHRQVSVRILAPLAVVQNRHRQGIGGRLIQAGLRQLEELGVDLVFVLGYPDYYSRFGFKPAGIQGLQATYPIPPQNADAWMVTELTPGTIENCQGTVRCSHALDHPKYWSE